MNRKMSSMEAKIDAKKPDETVYNRLAKIDGALDNVDDKVDDQELRLDSMKRAMERLHEANRKEWESFINLEKKIEKMDLVLRRIFGFHKSLEHLSAQQAEVSKGLQRLLDLAYPPPTAIPAATMTTKRGRSTTTVSRPRRSRRAPLFRDRFSL